MPVLLVFTSASVHALLADPKFDNFKSTVVGNKTTISYGSNGTVLAKTAPTFATAPNNAGVFIARKIPIAAGNAVVEVAATQLVSRKAIASMFGAAATAAIGSGLVASGIGIAALVALPYIADYLDSSGISLNKNLADTEHPFSYMSTTGGSVCPSPPSWFSCDELGGRAFSLSTVEQGGACFAVLDCQYFYSEAHFSYSRNLGAPLSTSSTDIRPLSLEQMQGLLSVGNFVLTPELLDAIAKVNGNIIPDPTDPVILTGPPQSEPYNVIQSTKTGPDGTTTTEDQCVRHFVYDTSSVSLEDTCTSVTTAPNGTKTTADTKTPVTGTAPLKDGAKNDLASPKPSTLPASTPTPSKLCDDFPSILACQTLDTPSGADIPKSSKTITYSQDNSFGAGSCPANKTMTVNGKQLTVVDWVSYCGYIADYLRPILILLASYAALIMLVPDKT